MVKQLDAILTDWEKAIEAADEKTLAAWSSTIAHVSTAARLDPRTEAPMQRQNTARRARDPSLRSG